MNCNICQTEMVEAFTQPVLYKYQAQYLSCPKCGFLQAQSPSWLDEAYSEAICSTDIGLLNRNITLSKKLSCFLHLNNHSNKPFLDVGGGLGVLTRLMRDNGFDFFWNDPYCQNQFANGFDKKETQNDFEALTFFEVFEHLEDPSAFIEKLLAKYEFNHLIFSTELFEGKVPAPQSWWYYTFHTGQHIAFYQKKTLEEIANKYNLRLYSHNGVHVFSKVKLNKFLVKLSLGKFSHFLFPFVNKYRHSYLEEDYKLITH